MADDPIKYCRRLDDHIGLHKKRIEGLLRRVNEKLDGLGNAIHNLQNEVTAMQEERKKKK